jgi:hypothetical protein
MNARRYKLMPLSDEERPAPGGIRRYGLARVAVSPRSAMGIDRHARLERVAERERKDSDGRGPDRGV